MRESRIRNIPTGEPIVAMTFDDGPHPANTPELLDLLARKRIRGTFFVLGKRAVDHPEILKRIVAEGHEIGNHTWTHPKLAEKSQEEARDELRRTQDLIVKITGVQPALMRPPSGSILPEQEQWIRDEFGYEIIFWAVDPVDWQKPEPGVITQRILDGAKPGDIILVHDYQQVTVKAMPATLDGLLARGFRFATVSELIALPTPSSPP